MITQKEEINNILDVLPEELSGKILDYAEYIRFSYVMDRTHAPANLIIKGKEDLIEKLEKGMESTKAGRVCSIEEAFAELDEILSK